MHKYIRICEYGQTWGAGWVIWSHHTAHNRFSYPTILIWYINILSDCYISKCGVGGQDFTRMILGLLRDFWNVEAITAIKKVLKDCHFSGSCWGGLSLWSFHSGKVESESGWVRICTRVSLCLFCSDRGLCGEWLGCQMSCGMEKMMFGKNEMVYAGLSDVVSG